MIRSLVATRTAVAFGRLRDALRFRYHAEYLRSRMGLADLKRIEQFEYQTHETVMALLGEIESLRKEGAR